MKIFLLALLCCLSPATARAADEPITQDEAGPDNHVLRGLSAADAPITQIKVLHSGCGGHGCTINELTLNADGNAEFAGINRDLQLSEGFYRGQVAPEHYRAIADFLSDNGFFDLRVEVGKSRSVHFGDTIVSVRRGFSNAAVVFHDGYQGKFLDRLAALYNDASAQISWKPDETASKSGVRGRSTRDATRAEINFFKGLPDSNQMPMGLSIVNLTSRDDPARSYSTRADARGNFQFFAPPGRYWLIAHDFNSSRPYQFDAPKWESEPVEIKIEADKFTSTNLKMSDANIGQEN